MSWIERLPRVLMATSSILVDVSLEETRDRILVQVVLWWMAILPLDAVSSSSPSPPPPATPADFWILLNGVFFVRIVMIPTVHWFHLFQIKTHLVTVNNLLDVFRVFPLATYMGFLYCYGETVVASATTQDHHDLKYYIFIVVCMTFLLAMVVRRQRKKQKRSNQTQPFFDESQWIHWSPSQVLYWLSETAAFPTTQPNSSFHNLDVVDHNNNSSLPDDYAGYYNHTTTVMISRLQSHNVSGSTLQFIQLQDLLQMRIPFGTACQLLNHIQTRLLRPYPPPSTGHHHPSLVKQETRHDENQMSSYWETLLQPREKDVQELQSNTFLDTTDPLVDETASDIMKQRFHQFNLPIPATTKESPQQETNPQKVDPANKNHSILQAMPSHIREIASRNPELVQQFLQQKRLSPVQEEPEPPPRELDPAILQAMPPHIREIASRNPELVQQFLSRDKLSSPEQQQLHRTTTHPVATQEENLSSLVNQQAAAAARALVQQNDDYNEFDNPTDDYDEQEMLLPPPPPTTNASTRKRSIKSGGLGFL